MICTIDANALILWASPKTDDLTLARLIPGLENTVILLGLILLGLTGTVE